MALSFSGLGFRLVGLVCIYIYILHWPFSGIGFRGLLV